MCITQYSVFQMIKKSKIIITIKLDDTGNECFKFSNSMLVHIYKVMTMTKCNFSGLASASGMGYWEAVDNRF